MVLVMKVSLSSFGAMHLETNFHKLTAFCWNVQDGRLPPNELVEFQKEKALVELPNLLDFTGYVVSKYQRTSVIFLRTFSYSSRLSLLARPLTTSITENGLKQACLRYRQEQTLHMCHKLVKKGRYLEAGHQP